MKKVTTIYQPGRLSFTKKLSIIIIKSARQQWSLNVKQNALDAIVLDSRRPNKYFSENLRLFISYMKVV